MFRAKGPSCPPHVQTCYSKFRWASSSKVCVGELFGPKGPLIVSFRCGFCELAAISFNAGRSIWWGTLWAEGKSDSSGPGFCIGASKPAVLPCPLLSDRLPPEPIGLSLQVQGPPLQGRAPTNFWKTFEEAWRLWEAWEGLGGFGRVWEGLEVLGWGRVGLRVYSLGVCGLWTLTVRRCCIP